MSPGTVICGFYGRSNLGDEAIAAGMVDLLRASRPGEPVLALSADPRGTTRDHGVPARAFRAEAAPAPRSTAALARTLLSNRRFVLGGGDLLRDSPTQDVVGQWLVPLRLAQSLRRKTALVGVSVGELTRPPSQDSVRRALAGTDFVVVRDEESRGRLLALDVQTPVHLGPDLALRLFTPDHRTAAPGGAGSDDRDRQVVVSVRGLADRATAAAAEAHRSSLRHLAAVLDGLVREGASVRLVPLRSRADRLQPVDDDYVASLELAHLAREGHRFEVVRHVPTVGALRDLLGAAHLVVGMRLHSVIMAAGLGVPAVALSYDSKVSGFCAEVGLSGLCADIADVTAGWLSGAVAVATSAPLGGAAMDAYRARTPAVERVVAGWA